MPLLYFNMFSFVHIRVDNTEIDIACCRILKPGLGFCLKMYIWPVKFGPVRGTARSGACGPRAARPVAGPGHGPSHQPAAWDWSSPVEKAARWRPGGESGPMAASFICCDL